MSGTTEAPGTARGAAEVRAPDRALQTQGRRAAEAKATMPDASCTRTVAAGDGDAGDRVVAALARALRDHPQANASYRDAAVERYPRVNVGLVLAHGDGSTLVTIGDADQKDAGAIAAERGMLAEKAAAGTLTAPDSAGATCSVVDLSGTGVTSVTPILVPPHAIALGIGGVQPDGTLTLSLTWDQRVLGPHAAAALLDAVADGLR